MKNINEYLIKENSRTIDALKQLDAVHCKIIFVVDDNKKLVGSISDGDIRRHILKAKSLDDDISCVQNNDPKYFTKSNFSSQKCMRTFEEMKTLRIIPITDENGVIEDLMTYEDCCEGKDVVRANTKIDIPVVIMAGGKGTRLRPFTDILPKPLIPIGEKTVLESILDHFHSLSTREQFLILNYKANMIEAYLDDNPSRYNLKYLREEEFLGTAGSLKLLTGKVDDTFILSNCDIIVKANYEEVLNLHKEKKAKLTILSAIKHYKIPYGVVEFADGGAVKEISEKPEYTVTINTGVYILDQSCLDLIPDGKRFDMPDLIDELLKRDELVLTYPVNEKDYADIGQWDEYRKSLKYFESVVSES